MENRKCLCLSGSALEGFRVQDSMWLWTHYMGSCKPHRSMSIRARFLDYAFLIVSADIPLYSFR